MRSFTTTEYRLEWFRAKSIWSSGPGEAKPNYDNEAADTGQRQQEPPRCPIHVVETPKRNRDAGKEKSKRDDRAEQPETCKAVHHTCDQSGDDGKQSPEPIFGSRCPTFKSDISLKSRPDGLREIHIALLRIQSAIIARSRNRVEGDEIPHKFSNRKAPCPDHPAVREDKRAHRHKDSWVPFDLPL